MTRPCFHIWAATKGISREAFYQRQTQYHLPPTSSLPRPSHSPHLIGCNAGFLYSQGTYYLFPAKYLLFQLASKKPPGKSPNPLESTGGWQLCTSIATWEETKLATRKKDKWRFKNTIPLLFVYCVTKLNLFNRYFLIACSLLTQLTLRTAMTVCSTFNNISYCYGSTDCHFSQCTSLNLPNHQSCMKKGLGEELCVFW